MELRVRDFLELHRDFLFDPFLELRCRRLDLLLLWDRAERDRLLSKSDEELKKSSGSSGSLTIRAMLLRATPKLLSGTICAMGLELALRDSSV